MPANSGSAGLRFNGADRMKVRQLARHYCTLRPSNTRRTRASPWTGWPCPPPATIRRPHATGLPTNGIGRGAFPAVGSVIEPSARVGIGADVNTSSSVDDEYDVDAWGQIAPGATLGVEGKVGNECCMDFGANVRQGLESEHAR